MSYEEKFRKLIRCIIVFGILTLVFFMFRFWLPCLICLVLLIAAIIYLNSLKDADKTQPKDLSGPLETMKPESIPGAPSIDEQVTEQVLAVYPNAKWVWAQSDTERRNASGEDVFIILNSSGGYRRAKVSISGNTVLSLDFFQSSSGRIDKKDELDSDMSDSEAEQVATDYGLIAFEWTDAHILELNERCNEAIGRGETELLLTAEELPLQESWPSICNELQRSGLEDVECEPTGIKIKFKQ